MANTFHLRILASDRNFFEGPCESIVFPFVGGYYGVLAHHANMISEIVPGTLSYRLPGEEMQDIFVSSGLVKIENNDVLVLVGLAEKPDEIDEKRALRAAENAKEEMLQRKSIFQYRSAQAQLARAAGRLRTIHHRDRQNK